MKILVTGSSGTIGTHLCTTLLEQGHTIIGVDKRPNQWNPTINKLTIIQDLRDYEKTLDSLPRDIDAIVHLAANARVHNLVIDPTLARDNFITVFNVLEFARLNNIPKFIFASSREVYGNSDKVIHSEDDASISLCASPYTSSKIGGEALVHGYQRCYDMSTAIVRFSNVYGMYDESDRVVPLFIKRSLAGEDLIVYGEDKLLDFTYIDDAVNGLSRILNNFDVATGDVFNLAYSEGTSLVAVAKQIKQLTESSSEIIVKPNRVGEVVKYVADISKAQSKLGYHPNIKVEDGISKSVDWYTTYLYNNDNNIVTIPTKIETN